MVNPGASHGRDAKDRDILTCCAEHRAQRRELNVQDSTAVLQQCVLQLRCGPAVPTWRF